MNTTFRTAGIAVISVLSACLPARAQTFDFVGTRAAGMGGAFVAVADDGSAVYWNPAGLASGAYFSLLLDYNSARAEPEQEPRAGSQSATFVALGLPAFGLTYYRLRATTVDAAVFPADRLDVPRPLDGPAVRVTSLVTHHTGVTLVQSLTDHIAVGTTLKLVRGTAAVGLVPPDDHGDLLDDAGDLIGKAETKFDADIGIMAVAPTVRAGLTVRNVTEPEFETPGDTERLRLDRQVRAGVALTGIQGLLISADVDLTRAAGTTGEVRNFATGAEARVLRPVWLRAGFRVNTLGDQPFGRTPVGTAGGTYAAFASLLIDGQVTFGSEKADRGWGIGARVVF